MGIRFNTNTWRAPLQLIDCWLPLNKPATETASTRSTGPTPRVLQRFIRAGWLNRQGQQAKLAPPLSAAHETPLSPSLSPARQCATAHHNSSMRWIKGRNDSEHARSDTRLVISGRIGDVCAELDRLAALEHRFCR